MLDKNINLVVGDIDSGKTRGIIFSEFKKMIDNNENLLILDSKEEYYPRFKKDLEEKGYNIFVVNLLDPSSSNGWNPLAYPYYLYKNSKIDQSLELVNKIFCKSDNKNVDPFWELTAADYLSSLIITLFKNGKENQINLGSLGVMLNNGEEKRGERTIAQSYFEALDPMDSAYVLASPTIFSPNETKSSILSVLRQKMNLFLTKPELLKMLSTNELRFDKIQDKTAIFVLSKNNVNWLTNILLEELIVSIKNNKRSFTFILDNFNALTRIEFMNELIENATYNKIKTIFSIHNIQEIVDKYDTNIFSKVTNVINMNEHKNVKLDEVKNNAHYPKLSSDKIEFIDVNEAFK